MESTARVLVLHTGGTLGMRQGPRGYAPSPGYLSEQLARLTPLHDPTQLAFTTPPTRHGRRVRYEVLDFDPLLDSSNMGMQDWEQIALAIERHYTDYDAFVVLHGTDTMAYTASALSFMLDHLGKTVILTGAQIPLAQMRNDALGNLLGALTLAGHYVIPEVCLYFHEKLLRGNRTCKVDASGFDAFASGNYPPLATVGVDIHVEWERVRPAPTGTLCVRGRMNPNVAALRLFPGITSDIIHNFLRPPLAGVVIETYGTGNAPDRRSDIMDALRQATDRGVVIVNCTQCLRGRVSTEYETGAALADAGVIGGADLTAESALTKLMFLLGLGVTTGEVKRLMQVDLRGELTSQPEAPRFRRP